MASVKHQHSGVGTPAPSAGAGDGTGCGAAAGAAAGAGAGTAGRHALQRRWFEVMGVFVPETEMHQHMPDAFRALNEEGAWEARPGPGVEGAPGGTGGAGEVFMELRDEPLLMRVVDEMGERLPVQAAHLRACGVSRR